MNQIEKFKASINPYRDGWQSIDMRSIGFPAFDKWVNLATRIMLSENPATPVTESELCPDFNPLKILREIRDIKDLDTILSQIENGILIVNNQEIQLAKIEGKEIKNNLSPSLHMQRKHYHWINPQPSAPYTITLYATGDSIHNLLHYSSDAIGSEDLDWKLRSLSVPYDGLDDLLSSFLDIPRQSRSRVIDSAILSVNAPIKLQFIDTTTLSRGKLNINIKSIGYKKLDDLSVGVIGFTTVGDIYRGFYKLYATDWTADGTSMVARKEVAVDDLTSAKLFLSFRGNVIDSLMLNDPSALLQNPRILAYSHFDENIERLQTYLGGKGKDSAKDFEKGVALLLHLCGFNSALYGQLGGIQEEIDIFAFVPFSNDIIAVECTTKEIDANGKLSKFVRRTKELSERLGDFHILPLIFTALEREKVSAAELEMAKMEFVGVVTADEIQELMSMAVAQKQPEDIFAYLESLVPESPLLFSSPRRRRMPA